MAASPFALQELAPFQPQSILRLPWLGPGWGAQRLGVSRAALALDSILVSSRDQPVTSP
jgi:hypothetical protein